MKAPALSFFSVTACLLFVLTSTSSCDFGSCRGVDGDFSPPIYEIVLDHSLSSSQPKTQIIEFERRMDIENIAFSLYPNKSRLFSLDQAGERIFINSNYFDAETEKTRIGLATSDSLSFCSFTRASDDAICVVTRSDTLYNPIATRTVPVEIAQSSISMWEDIRDFPTIFRRDTASFISEEDYQVTTALHPVTSNDKSLMAYVQEKQIRRIIRDDIGEVIREAVISKQRDLVIQNVTSNVPPEVLLENVPIDNSAQHYVAISPDGNQVALALDDGIIQVINIPDNSTMQLEGVQYPEFTSSSRFLVAKTVARDNLHDLIIYNLENQSLQATLTPVHGYYNVDASRDVIFFYSQRTTTTNEEGLRMYSIEDRSETVLFEDDDINAYERSLSNGRRSANLPSTLYFEADGNGHLHLFGQIYFNLLDDC